VTQGAPNAGGGLIAVNTQELAAEVVLFVAMA
jgi:hypothetical protein